MTERSEIPVTDQVAFLPNCAELLPVATLLNRRLQELGISRTGLISRLGYSNTAKAHRRLEELCAGELSKTADLISRLPNALDLSAATVDAAIVETRAQLQSMRERTERAAFRPHGIILTERRQPSSITLAAFTGADRWLKIDLSGAADDFVQQVMGVIAHRVRMFGGAFPFYGRAIGFVINYRYDLSVRYDVDGDAVPDMRRADLVTFEINGGRSVLPLLRSS